MKGFRGDRADRGGGNRGDGKRRADGGRPMKSARSTVPKRPADAELGRSTRTLVASGRRGGERSRVRTLLGLPGTIRRIVTPARAAAMLAMLACGFAFTFVTGSTAFALTRADVPTLTWTDEELVRDTLDLPEGANVFRLQTEPIVARLLALPAVAAASVTVSLPDAAVVVHIEEREPVLAWQAGEARFIADRTGTIFATVPADTALPAGTVLVDDRRQAAGGVLGIGGHLDAVDFDVATRLGSLTPADVGSVAPSLQVAVTDADGYVLVAPRGWTAVFGFYSPSTRPTDMIPDQVRLLRSLLDGREAILARVILASGTDGTYVPRATPKPTPR
jgi:hypothetical protein